MDYEILNVPLKASTSTSDEKRKVQICHVAGRFFASKYDAEYLETNARVCINRTPNTTATTTTSSSSSKSSKKSDDVTPINWNHNSNFMPILDELVAVLVEFGFADVFRIQMTSSEFSSSEDVQMTSEPSTSSEIPMMTSPKEDSGKMEKKALRIQEIPFPDTKEFRTKRLVVRDFWRKGYFIADGTRFGGDYLVYTASPNKCHAEFVLLCTPITDTERISAMRCCNQVKKTLILATSSAGSTQPHYTKCEWFRPELF